MNWSHGFEITSVLNAALNIRVSGHGNIVGAVVIDRTHGYRLRFLVLTGVFER
jgi:hypothetical protein